MTNLNKHDREVAIAELDLILDYAANAQSKDGIVRYIESRIRQHDKATKRAKKSKAIPKIEQSVESGLYAHGDTLFKSRLDVDDAVHQQCTPKPYTYDGENNGFTKRRLDYLVNVNSQLIKLLSERKFMVDEYSSEAILRPKELEKILTDFKYVDNDALEDEE